MSIRYTDTRGYTTEPLEFSEAVIKGIAEGNGLFVPEQIPHMDIDEIIALGEQSYAEAAATIYKLFQVDFDDSKVDELMAQAYSTNFDVEAIAPVRQVGDMHVLELWHGPTSAFKDMALQCLPLFFSASIEKKRAAGASDEDYLIAVATSGDTGKAALQGFANRNHISIIVYYPHGGVSDIQYKQMATQLGDNVCVCAAKGNFDDCQTSVKLMFGDEAFNAKLKDEHNVVLSSANSINWGRLMPQIVYYINSYSQMVASGAVKAGEAIDVCVPTGNFGNILACWYAKQIGTPIDQIVCASNENRVLTDFIETGSYTTAGREFKLTPSPSMDILVSSNLERQLFELTGRNPELIRQWMDDLKSKGSFTVDEATFEKMKSNYRGGSVNNAECLETIHRVFEEESYLLDPHTAVAWRVAEQFKGENPMLIASTAHWAKFGGNVYRALKGIAPGEELPVEVQELTGAQLNRVVSELAHVDRAPKALDDLDDMEIRFKEVIEGTTEAVEAAVERFTA